MRTTHLLAAALIAVGTATALAAPAIADETDERFLDALKDEGVPYETKGQALELATSACRQLESGSTPQDVLLSLRDATGWSNTDIINFGKVAVIAYCPGQMPEQLG